MTRLLRFAATNYPECHFMVDLKAEPATLNRQKMIDLKQQYWVCDSTKAEKEIGYCAKFPLEKGIKETARWYLDSGWL